MLQRRDINISKVKHHCADKYVQRTMDFRIEFPKLVQLAISPKKKNVNTLLYDVIPKEMCSVLVAFDIREKGDTPTPQHHFIKCHILFNVDM